MSSLSPLGGIGKKSSKKKRRLLPKPKAKAAGSGRPRPKVPQQRPDRSTEAVAPPESKVDAKFTNEEPQASDRKAEQESSTAVSDPYEMGAPPSDEDAPSMRRGHPDATSVSSVLPGVFEVANDKDATDYMTTGGRKNDDVVGTMTPEHSHSHSDSHSHSALHSNEGGHSQQEQQQESASHGNNQGSSVSLIGMGGKKKMKISSKRKGRSPNVKVAVGASGGGRPMQKGHRHHSGVAVTTPGNNPMHAKTTKVTPSATASHAVITSDYGEGQTSKIGFEDENDGGASTRHCEGETHQHLQGNVSTYEPFTGEKTQVNVEGGDDKNSKATDSTVDEDSSGKNPLSASTVNRHVGARKRKKSATKNTGDKIRGAPIGRKKSKKRGTTMISVGGGHNLGADDDAEARDQSATGVDDSPGCAALVPAQKSSDGATETAIAPAADGSLSPNETAAETPKEKTLFDFCTSYILHITEEEKEESKENDPKQLFEERRKRRRERLRAQEEQRRRQASSRDGNDTIGDGEGGGGAPRVEIVDGEIVVSEASLYVDNRRRTVEEIDAEQGNEVVEEEGSNHIITCSYNSFVNWEKRKKWDVEKTRLFYDALRQCGPDFTIMEQFFKGECTRNQLKKKYHLEMRKNPHLIDMALHPTAQTALDLSVFNVTEEEVKNLPVHKPVVAEPSDDKASDREKSNERDKDENGDEENVVIEEYEGVEGRRGGTGNQEVEVVVEDEAEAVKPRSAFDWLNSFADQEEEQARTQQNEDELGLGIGEESQSYSQKFAGSGQESMMDESQLFESAGESQLFDSGAMQVQEDSAETGTASLSLMGGMPTSKKSKSKGRKKPKGKRPFARKR